MYVKTSIGGNYVAHTKARTVEDLVEEPVFSDNVSEADGTVTFVTQREDNYFNALDVQLYRVDHKSFVKRLNRRNTVGKASFIYQHQNGSGTYCIRIKVNSNIKDEYVDYEIYLEQGEWYSITYELLEMSEKHIVIDSF